jgi:hypothetical protein
MLLVKLEYEQAQVAELIFVSPLIKLEIFLAESRHASSSVKTESHVKSSCGPVESSNCQKNGI